VIQMIPPSKFECPRCGYGVRPGDLQCGRCGGDLRPKANKQVEVNLTGVKLDRTKTEECAQVRIRSVEPVPVNRPDSTLQYKTDDMERRDRALREREMKLAAKTEELKELSQRSRDTEHAHPEITRSEMDEMRQKIRDDLVRQFEPELEALQLQLQEKESELQEVREHVRASECPVKTPTVSKEELDRMTEEIFQELQGQLMNPLKVDSVGLVKTNIPKLDDALGGGFPQGNIILFNGAPGTMKSILAYTIMHRAAIMDGTSGLYLSMGQNRRSLVRQMEKLGMPLEATGGRLRVADLKDMEKATESISGNWRDLMLEYVHHVQKEIGFKVFVLDSLESFKAVSEHCFARQDLKDLFDWFKSLGITVLVISENISDEWDEENQGEAYLSDGIMELRMREMADSRVQRWVRCVKMRGANADHRYYAMFHDGKDFNMSLPLANKPF
jgi:KaiC/GvpD/RAD55 family RecA-like ATPase